MLIYKTCLETDFEVSWFGFDGSGEKGRKFFLAEIISGDWSSFVGEMVGVDGETLRVFIDSKKFLKIRIYEVRNFAKHWLIVLCLFN